MQRSQRWVPWGAAVLLFALVTAASASAVTLRTGSSTGTPLAVGATVTGVNSGDVVLSGTFFGIPSTNTCTGSAMGATVRANPTANGNVWARVDSYSFSGCTSTAYPGGCSVVATGLSWDPVSPGGDGGGLEAISSTSVRLATGDASTNWLDWSDCMPNKATCRFKGLTAGPATDTGYSLSNYITGTWTNGASNAQLALNSALGIVSCTATSTNFRATYRFTTSGGQQVYLG